MSNSLRDTFEAGWNAVWRLPARCYRRLRRSDPEGPASRRNLPEILAHWNLRHFDAEHIGTGACRLKWFVTSGGERYVLRAAGSLTPYVDFQVRIMNHLSQSDFPYRSPVLLESRAGYWIEYEDRCWILYRFIEGRQAREITTVGEAHSLGCLVAHYHRATGRMECDDLQEFVLPLFRTTKSRDLLRDSTAAIVRRSRRGRAEAAFLESVDSIMGALSSTTDAERSAIKRLRTVPVYVDWAPNNILMLGHRINGLIDFDSVGAGPDLLDFQSALGYAAGTGCGFDGERILAFARGYLSVRPVPQSELELVPTIMIDQVGSFVARMMAAADPEIAWRSRSTLVFLVENLRWLINHRERFHNLLMAAAEAEPAEAHRNLG